MEFPVPEDEAERLRALYALDLLDQGPQAHFDCVTRLAARVLEVPICLVSLVDDDRQWFASRHGLEAAQTDRCDAFCAHAIMGDQVFVIPDARNDERFSQNPLVLGPPSIRFYAGAPVRAPGGNRLGTLCVIDSKPRQLDDGDLRTLRDLADILERQLQLTELAAMDHLTGLGNRRAFTAAATRFVNLGRRKGEPVTVICADIDGLKQANDDHGHGAGDRLIRQCAEVLVESVRSSDLVARLGGDEFAVLLYGADEAGAEAVVGHVEAAMKRLGADRQAGPCLAVSLGHATARPDEDLVHLLSRADDAMYRNKAEACGGQRRDTAPAEIGQDRSGEVSDPSRPVHDR